MQNGNDKLEYKTKIEFSKSPHMYTPNERIKAFALGSSSKN